MLYMCRDQSLFLLVMTYRAMERSMQRITLCDQIWSYEIREWSRVKDLIVKYRKQNFRRAGHVTSFTENSWTRVIVEWYPKDCKRPLERPSQRWGVEIVKRFEPIWRRFKSKTGWECIVASDVENIRQPGQ